MHKLGSAIFILAICFSIALTSCQTASPTEETSAQSPPPANQAQVAPTPMPTLTPTPPEGTGQLDLHAPEAQDDPPEWKIAFVTFCDMFIDEEYRSVKTIMEKYGQDRVIHRIWPLRFSSEGEKMISILLDIAEDPEVKALVINPAVINTNAAVARFRELRDDVFIVYCSPQEDIDEVTRFADLILEVNHQAIGNAFVMQAKAMGAETIVHYSFPRHMASPEHVIRRDEMKKAAEREGIRFVELTAPDPMGDGGAAAMQEHIAQDLPKQVERFGKNTAFFGTNCAMQIPLITKVVETGTIYPQPCCPSPYHGFPTALGIASYVPTGEFNPDTGAEMLRRRTTREIIEATRDGIAARGASGRLSNWPVPASMAWTVIGAEYAIELIEGNVPQERGVIDLDVISRFSMEYILHTSGESMGGMFVPLEHEGRSISHFILGIFDYLTN